MSKSANAKYYFHQNKFHVYDWVNLRMKFYPIRNKKILACFQKNCNFIELLHEKMRAFTN